MPVIDGVLQIPPIDLGNEQTRYKLYRMKTGQTDELIEVFFNGDEAEHSWGYHVNFHPGYRYKLTRVDSLEEVLFEQ